MRNNDVVLAFFFVFHIVDVVGGGGGGGISGVAVDVIAGTQNVVAHFLVSSDTICLVNCIIKSKSIVFQGLQQQIKIMFFI